jgi:hypothetical protein
MILKTGFNRNSTLRKSFATGEYVLTPDTPAAQQFDGALTVFLCNKHAVEFVDRGEATAIYILENSYIFCDECDRARLGIHID